MSADFLQAMADASRRRVHAARRELPDGDAFRRARELPPAPPLALDARFDVIAEVKLRSPAATVAMSGGDLGRRVGGYAGAGAAAVSVLTEPSRFDGSLADLATTAGALAPLGIPAMRKDFIVDAYQLAEARAAGAGGALLILRLLTRDEAVSLVGMARELGLFLLLEAFDEQDLALARDLLAELGPDDLLVGVNSRDLATLQVIPDRCRSLAEHLPAGVPCVAESGLRVAEDARAIARAGYRAALVGTALMQAGDPPALLREMIAAGRSA